jgi:hypothetical protein
MSALTNTVLPSLGAARPEGEVLGREAAERHGDVVRAGVHHIGEVAHHRGGEAPLLVGRRREVHLELEVGHVELLMEGIPAPL